MSSDEERPEPNTAKSLEPLQSAAAAQGTEAGACEVDPLRELIDCLPHLVWTCEPSGACDYLSKQWIEYTGIPEAAQRGIGWLQQVHPADRDALMVTWNNAVASGTAFFAEFRLRRHDGLYRWFDTRAVPLRDGQRRIVKWFGSNTDIEDRKRALAALRESEERLQTVLAHMTEGLIISNLDGLLLHWNPASLAMHGFQDQAECLRQLPEFQDIFELYTLSGEKLGYEQWPMPRIFRGEVVRDLEIRIRRTDIAWERIFSYSGAKVTEPSGRALAFLTVTDHTQRQQVADALEESAARLRLANEAAGIGTYEIDFEQQKLRLSPEMSAILGMPAQAELNLGEGNHLVHPDDLAMAQRAFRATLDPASDGSLRLDVRVLRPNGEVRWVTWSGRTFFRDTPQGRVPTRALGAAFDVTERHELEVRLRQAQKMEAVGQLSGGIAHDFNNILGIIAGNVQLALEDLDPNHPAAELLSEVMKAGKRAKDLVQRILTFARRQPQAQRVFNVPPVLNESIELLRATLPAGVTLRLTCDPAVPPIAGDPTQLQQVVLNLVTNAWHALADDQGQIDVELASAVLGREEADKLTGTTPGPHVRLSVTDTGQGMDSATLERIFEPFFTTKAPGTGTGLGLSVVHGIVEAHGGAIRVNSTPGRGTRFDVYIPAVPERAPRANSERPGVATGEGQHILYVEDEEALGTLANRLFKRLGYRVTWFGRAREALQAFRREPQAFDLAITDMNMPELSGLQVAEELLAIRPGLPVVLISGNITDELRGRAMTLGVRSVIYKPFDIPMLTQTVQQLLSERS